jgi:predicted nuclease of predicted toxin-antitoxin system
MRFKLDENLDFQAVGILAVAGHDVLTANEQGLQSASDAKIASVCKHEKRCLITLDKHFANPVAYPPEKYFGIIVIRPHRAIRPIVLDLVREVVQALRSKNIDRSLWVVEPGRIRIHKRIKFPEEL